MNKLNTKKLLSICLVGRNDDYTSDFLYRMSTTINFIAHSCSKINRLQDIEIIVTDWCSKTPLSEVIELSESALDITKFIHVSPIHESNYEDKKLPVNLSMNIGFKQARGDFIALCGADSIIPSGSMNSLFLVLEGKSLFNEPEKHFYICGRYTIPSQFVDLKPNISNWEEFLRLNSWQIEPEITSGAFLSGGAGFIMTHKDIINECTGLYEGFDPCWGWSDVEYAIRLESYYEWYDLKSSGFVFYNMEHGNKDIKRTEVVKKMPPYEIISALAANKDNWGGADLQISTSLGTLKVDSLEVNQGEIPSPALFDLTDSEGIQVVKDFVLIFNADSGWPIQIIGSEVVLMLLLRAIFKANLNNHLPVSLLDLGVKSGQTSFFAGTLYNYMKICAVDFWNGIDNKTGPQEFSKKLHAEPINHRGYVRFYNRKTADFFRDSKTSLDGFKYSDVIIFRDDNSLEINQLEELSNSLSDNGYLIITFHSVKRAELFIDIYSYLNIQLIDNDNLIYLASANTYSIKNFTADTITEILTPPIVEEKWSYVEIVGFYESIDKLPEGQFILYGYGTVGKIMWPKIKAKVIAIIDKHLSSQKIKDVDGIPVINLRELSEFKDTLVVISPSIYEEEILEELKDYSNRTYTVPLH